MKKAVFLLPVFLFLTFCYHCFSCRSDDKYKKQSSWNLIWSDEFEVNGKPNPLKWEFSGRKRAKWACNCYDDTSTIYVKDGLLYLRGILNNSDFDTSKYQTGCIQTRGKFSFTYGKIEVKAKFSQGKGSWPAIWAMPANSSYGEWPKSGEIDLMEHLNFDSNIYQTLHTEYIDILNKKTDPLYSKQTSFNPSEFNVFGMEWEINKIIFFVNGQKTLIYPKNMEESSQWPFDKPFYIILNQALGGWAGLINESDLPQQMIVDWVRVYQLH